MPDEVQEIRVDVSTTDVRCVVASARVILFSWRLAQKTEHDRCECQTREHFAETRVVFANACCVTKKRSIVLRFESRRVHQLGK